MGNALEKPQEIYEKYIKGYQHIKSCEYFSNSVFDLQISALPKVYELCLEMAAYEKKIESAFHNARERWFKQLSDGKQILYNTCLTKELIALKKEKELNQLYATPNANSNKIQSAKNALQFYKDEIENFIKNNKLGAGFEKQMSIYRAWYYADRSGTTMPLNKKIALIKGFSPNDYYDILQKAQAHKTFPEAYFAVLTKDCKDLIAQPENNNNIVPKTVTCAIL